jgi:hypothetical protein
MHRSRFNLQFQMKSRAQRSTAPAPRKTLIALRA